MGVGPISRLPIVPSMYHEHAAQRCDPERLSDRANRDKAALCPLDHVNRQFHAAAPNRLWLSDFTSPRLKSLAEEEGFEPPNELPR